VKEQSADLAWVIGVSYQGNGFATEAMRVVVEWLKANFPILELRAMIHSQHAASQRVAQRIGLHPTEETNNAGEQLWSVRL
jgi:RimJ/RimL family protein N-acetyltransferase